MEKYYKVLNIVRSNDGLKSSAAGAEIETQARLNIALCKLNTKDFDVAIDQCERVLDKDAKNSKALFRLATALYEKSEKCTKPGTQGEIRAIHNYMKKATQNNPNDKKLREFYNEVRNKFDSYEDDRKQEERAKEILEGKKTTEDAQEKTQAEKKGLKRVIVTDPEEEKSTAA